MSALRVQAARTEGCRFWQTHIKAFAKSGFSRREYCRKHNLSYHALTYWLRKQSSSRAPAPITLIEVPMRLPVTDGQSSVPLRLRLDSKWTIEIETNFDEATLAKVLTVLEQRR